MAPVRWHQVQNAAGDKGKRDCIRTRHPLAMLDDWRLRAVRKQRWCKPSTPRPAWRFREGPDVPRRERSR